MSNGGFLLDERRIGLDARVALFMALATIGATALIATVVALPATRIGLVSGLSEASRRGSAGRPQQRVASCLVGLQTALATLLLVGATLLIASFARVLRVDPGYVRNGVVTATMRQAPAAYDSAAAVRDFTSRVLRALRTDPSSAGIAAASSLPLQRGWNLGVELTDRPEASEGAAEWRAVSPEFFAVYGIPVIRGRALTEGDRSGSEPVVVVSQSFAASYWPGQDPLGQRITIGRFRGRQMGPRFADQPRTVVGVVPDLRDMSLEQRRPRHTMWIPWDQAPAGMVNGRLPAFAVRARDVRAATKAVTAAIASVDPRLRNAQIVTMNSVVSKSLASRRFNLVLVASFAAIAVLLTCVGVYGVVAYSVSRRTNEIGIRMALGAAPRAVAAMVLRQGMLPVSVGLIGGLAASLALRSYLSSMLFEVKANDPFVLASAALLLTVVASIANYVPARRAAQTNPVAALRAE